MTSSAKFDRTQEDVGNITHLEHVNVWVADQRLATLFYVTGLGLTRDPFLMTSVDNMWVNVGTSQFHLITGKPQVLRGRTGLVIPDRAFVLKRLESIRSELKGTRFDVTAGPDYIDTICPWGNRLRIHEPAPRFGRVALGMPYVEFDVPQGTADGICRFYRDILAAPATVIEDNSGRCARVKVGRDQGLWFRETSAPPTDYDGHHIQVYVSDFSGPHRRLLERGLISEESDQWQYRFVDIVDPKDGRKLFVIEHEVRSTTHPLCGRPLVNRNPYQTNRSFVDGYETRQPMLPYAASSSATTPPDARSAGR
jgi:catechol 2,3-dioxygenase-like lactoylglutathione lyase family enzyme